MSTYFTATVSLHGTCCRRRLHTFHKGQVYEIIREAKLHLEVVHPRTKDPVYINLSPWLRQRITITPAELDLSNLFK